MEINHSLRGLTEFFLRIKNREREPSSIMNASNFGRHRFSKTFTGFPFPILSRKNMNFSDANLRETTQVPILNAAFTVFPSDSSQIFVVLSIFFSFQILPYSLIYSWSFTLLVQSVEEKDGIQYDSDFSRIEELIKGNTFTRYFSHFGGCPSFSVKSSIFGDFGVGASFV